MVSVQAAAVDIPGEVSNLSDHSETIIIVRTPSLCPRDERFVVSALRHVAQNMISMLEAATKK